MRSTEMVRLQDADEHDATFFGESIAVAEVTASTIRSVALRGQVLAHIRERRLSFSLDPDGLLWVQAGAVRLFGVPLHSLRSETILGDCARCHLPVHEDGDHVMVVSAGQERLYFHADCGVRSEPDLRHTIQTASVNFPG
jgi:hypothetical protein